MNISGVYFIADSGKSAHGVIKDIEEAIAGGCKIVQYREKNKSFKEMLTECREIKRACSGKALFIINDRPALAWAVNANGVHLGQNDMPTEFARKLLGDKIIGRSSHSLAQAIDAAKGADYIAIGPIFKTSTKPGATPVGVETIRAVKKAVRKPVVAIGGINRNNVVECINAGADAVAVISAGYEGGVNKGVKDISVQLTQANRV